MPRKSGRRPRWGCLRRPRTSACTKGGLVTTNVSSRPRTCTDTSAHSCTDRSSKARAIPCRRVGEHVPEVTRFTGC
jgi:hypothetical protein